tara:strand:- start:296 stop:1591 length:1296 start_codon:yes stop_codon:yes gene_type:complete
MKYEPNKYPFQHYIEGKKVSIDEACNELKTFDVKTDQTFNMDSPAYTMTIEQDNGPIHTQQSMSITDKLTIECTLQTDTKNDIGILDYVNDFEKDLNSHMADAVNMFPGPYVLLNSGGIDCALMGAWLYKNKCDFQVTNMINLPFGTDEADIQSDRIQHVWKSMGVKVKTMDVSPHDRVKNYLSEFTRAPKSFDCNLHGYDNLLKQFCNGNIAVDGLGSNYTMLHLPQGIGHAFISLDYDTYKKMLRTDTFSRNGVFDLLLQEKYQDGRKPTDATGMMDFNYFNNKLPSHASHGWRMWRHIIEQVPQWEFHLTSEDWFNKFQRIDYSKLTLDLTRDLLDCKHWKNIISKWASPELASKSKTTNNGKNYYIPSNEMYSECFSLLQQSKEYWKGNFQILKELVAMEYMLQRFNRISPQAIQLMHFFKWRQNSS